MPLGILSRPPDRARRDRSHIHGKRYGDFPRVCTSLQDNCKAFDRTSHEGLRGAAGQKDLCRLFQLFFFQNEHRDIEFVTLRHVLVTCVTYSFRSTSKKKKRPAEITEKLL